MSKRAAVVGVGQTKYTTARTDVSIAGLVREAAQRALDDAEVGWGDIDAVVIGTAPDMFEGVMMPELYLADAMGANGRPMLRVHTAGSVGGSTALVAALYVHSGAFERVLTMAFEKQSESNAMWALSVRMPFVPHVNSGAGGMFAPLLREYIRRSKAPDHIGMKVAVKDRLNAVKNPYAHLQLADISVEKVAESPMLWEPIRFLESCPSSDGACAMVIADERLTGQSPRPPAWIHATATRTEPTFYAWREMVRPQAAVDCAREVCARAGVGRPARDLDMAELYVPFSWHEPMWLEALGFAEEEPGWKMVDEGATALDGSMPINCSGGVLSSNPIGAAGMVRFAEAANQVRGLAGEHQVEGARKALGHAFGGHNQYHAMWIVGADKP